MKYDLNRTLLTEDEKRRIENLLAPGATPSDSFEDKFLLYLKYGVGKPTTRLGRAWVKYVDEYKKQKYAFNGDEMIRSENKSSVSDEVKNAGIFNTNAWQSSKQRNS